MRAPHVDDRIRLMADIPELSLSRGEIGVIRSTWFAPSVAYEVEFQAGDDAFCTRTLLSREQLQLEENDGAEDTRMKLRERPTHLHG